MEGKRITKRFITDTIKTLIDKSYNIFSIYILGKVYIDLYFPKHDKDNFNEFVHEENGTVGIIINIMKKKISHPDRCDDYKTVPDILSVLESID